MQSNIKLELSARHLRAVLALVEYRSFIAAAAFLKVSQPALTRTIKQVEASLGVVLFSRTTRQVEVTRAGKEFAALAERVLNDFSISLDSLRKDAGQPAGQVIVSSVLSIANALLPGMLADFGKRYPGVQIHLREGIHRDVVDDVRGGIADFAVGYADGLPVDLLFEDLGAERLRVVMQSAHPLARRKRLPIEALADLTLVSFPRESRSRQLADAAAAGAGFSLRYAMTVNRLPTLFELVRNQMGVAIVPASECPASGDRALTSRPLAGARVVSRLGVIRARERVLSPAAAILLVVIRRWIRGAISERSLR